MSAAQFINAYKHKREELTSMDMKSEVRKATGAVKKALSPEPARAEETDILDTLKKEHDEVKALLAELQDAENGPQRGRLVQQIKMALVPHTKAEEKVVYDRVIALRDKDAQIDGHEGYVEHELASKTLQRLDSMGASTSAEHQAVAKVLKELVEHHIKEEESNVWSDVKKSFSEEDRFEMNVQFEAAKARVKIP
jgi:hemerythrin superfamily protein